MPRASWVKRHIVLLASFSQRFCQGMVAGILPLILAPAESRPMLAPAVILIAFWAAILAFVFPFISGAMLHSKLAATFWILANQRFMVRTLTAAKTAALFNLVQQRLKLLAARFSCASRRDPLSLGKMHAVR